MTRPITSSIVFVAAITVLSPTGSSNATAALYGEGGDVAGNEFSTAMLFGNRAIANRYWSRPTRLLGSVPSPSRKREPTDRSGRRRP